MTNVRLEAERALEARRLRGQHHKTTCSAFVIRALIHIGIRYRITVCVAMLLCLNTSLYVYRSRIKIKNEEARQNDDEEQQRNREMLKVNAQKIQSQKYCLC